MSRVLGGGSEGAGLGGPSFLDGGNVFNDRARERLKGGAALDWLFGNSEVDKPTGRLTTGGAAETAADTVDLLMLV